MRLNFLLRCVAAGILLLLLSSLSANSTRAELRLPAVISDNMVLQSDHTNPVWGWAKSGEKVVIAVAGHTVAGKAGQDGRWRLVLPNLPIQAPTDRNPCANVFWLGTDHSQCVGW